MPSIRYLMEHQFYLHNSVGINNTEEQREFMKTVNYSKEQIEQLRQDPFFMFFLILPTIKSWLRAVKSLHMVKGAMCMTSKANVI